MEDGKHIRAGASEPPHNAGGTYTPRRVTTDGRSEVDRFYTCRVCGQTTDRTSVYQVLYHEEGGHDPMSEFELALTASLDVER